jgi:hypothetical protein
MAQSQSELSASAGYHVQQWMSTLRSQPVKIAKEVFAKSGHIGVRFGYDLKKDFTLRDYRRWSRNLEGRDG